MNIVHEVNSIYEFSEWRFWYSIREWDTFNLGQVKFKQKANLPKYCFTFHVNIIQTKKYILE